jgi:O-antigen/teichoic acid export membrane protein
MPFLGGRFVNPAYWSGLSIIPIILGAYYFNGLYTNFAASVYIRKRTAYLPAITGTAAAANVALNFLLIPYYGIWGAAYATLGAYMLSAALMYRLTRKIYPLRYEWRRLIIAIGACVMIFFAAEFSTSDMTLGGGFLARCAWILVYPLLLFALGLFKSEEEALLRQPHYPTSPK